MDATSEFAYVKNTPLHAQGTRVCSLLDVYLRKKLNLIHLVRLNRGRWPAFVQNSRLAKMQQERFRRVEVEAITVSTGGVIAH
jgi:hypothetical protein